MEDNTSIQFSQEHRKSIYDYCKSIRLRMVEVPEGDVTIEGKVFHVGTFKIAKTMFSVSDWTKVIHPGIKASKRPITDLSFLEVSYVYHHLRFITNLPGKLTLPTEAQLVLARQKGLIKIQNKYKEFCFTEFRSPEEMGEHHYFGNVPEKNVFDLVVRCGDKRSSMLCLGTDACTGFRMALVDYNSISDKDR